MSEEPSVTQRLREQAFNRHRAIGEVVQWFDDEKLEGLPRAVSQRCAELASDMLTLISVDDPELISGLSALVQVKDHFVRAAIAVQREAGH